MSMIKKEIKDFTINAYQNEEFYTVTKSDLLGKWNILFFYPADFTFICPTELEDLQNYYDQFKAINCEIYAVSTDSHYVHKAWHDHSKRVGKITYPMLADTSHTLCRDFDVLIEEAGEAERASFVLNPEGKVTAYEVHADNVGRNAEELLRKVKAAQFVYQNKEEVCPAKWQPGAETLKPSLNLVGLL